MWRFLHTFSSDFFVPHIRKFQQETVQNNTPFFTYEILVGLEIKQFLIRVNQIFVAWVI